MLTAYLVLLCEFFWEFSIYHFCRPLVDIYWHPLLSCSITTFPPFCLMLYLLSNLVYFPFLLSFPCLDLSKMLTCLGNSVIKSLILLFHRGTLLPFRNVHISAPFHSGSSWMTTGPTLPYSGTSAGWGSFTSFPGSTPIHAVHRWIIICHLHSLWGWCF